MRGGAVCRLPSAGRACAAGGGLVAVSAVAGAASVLYTQAHKKRNDKTKFFYIAVNADIMARVGFFSRQCNYACLALCGVVGIKKASPKGGFISYRADVRFLRGFRDICDALRVLRHPIRAIGRMSWISCTRRLLSCAGSASRRLLRLRVRLRACAVLLRRIGRCIASRQSLRRVVLLGCCCLCGSLRPASQGVRRRRCGGC